MSKTLDLIKRHQQAVRTEQGLRAQADSLDTEARTAPAGRAFSLTTKAQRCRDRAFGASLRQMDLEDALCKQAEKDDVALRYMEDYYASLGLLPALP